MTNKLSIILEILLAPIRRYPISFIFLTISLFLPDMTAEVIIPWIVNNPSLFLYRLLFYGGIAYVLISIAHFIASLSTKAGTLLIIIIHICIYALVFADIFLYKFFGSHINTYMLQLVNETNTQETSEFINTYVHTDIFTRILILLILFVSIEFALFKLHNSSKCKHLNNTISTVTSRCKAVFSWLVGLFVASSLGFLIYVLPGFSFDWASNMEVPRIWDCGLIRCFVFKAYQSGVQFFDERSAFERSEKANRQITASRSDTFTPQNIVIIIGESYNRHHSSLYGYDHETNPRLSKLDHLYVFDDVIAPINGTSPVFKSFFSLASVGDSLEWCDVPLFPAIFKHVGYNVSFFSNQFVKKVDMSPWDASAGFFNNPHIEPRLFTYRNHEKHQFDEGLVKEFVSQRTVVERDSFNLMFFHLIGQHVDTDKRFPKGREIFHPSDYLRPELSEEQKQEVANYDNATHYNDSVVFEIIKLYRDKDAIILYFADHGDEANDYRPHIGRDFHLNIVGAPGLHCQLDVPFLICLTDSCSTLHPELEHRIATATHLPFMLDDLPHLLLDIADIQTPWFQPSRSLINDQYNAKRHRIIEGYSTTSPIDYDAVCNAYGEWSIGY